MIQLPRYAVQQLLCETTHSHVYRGFARADRRPVAIKVARESSDAAHAAAQQELEIIRKLDGQVTVRGIELDYADGRSALVMELFPGGAIDEWLAGRPLDVDRFLRVGRAIASALAGVHDCGVIHRDIKPSNILINPETLEVCIAGFGVAASLDGAMSIQAAAMVGSLAYLSPEQTGRMNRRVDSRSDLYSLGVTFYQMLTGKLPFAQARPLELVHAHFALTPRSAREINRDVPAALSEVISKLLCKGPDERYQSAQGVEADLRELAAQRAAGQPLGGFPLGHQDRARALLLPTRLYGRDAELTLLDQCLARVQRGAVELLAVGGASGSGKTALFAEAQQRLVLQRGHFIKGKFDRLARNVPFSAVSQALTGLVEQLLARTDRELEAIRGELVRKLAGLGQVIIEIAPAVEKIIGAQPAVPGVGLRQSQARISEVFLRFVSALATRDHPLVIVLDDLQWADSGSLMLVAALIDEARDVSRGIALLLLCAYRDGELTAGHPFRELLGAPGQTAAGVHEATLRPLEVRHVAELLSDTLRVPLGNVAALAETVFRKTSGNAFFVHQFLRHAHRLGQFRFAAGDGWQWDLAAIEAAGIPDDAAGLMVEKIRSLSPTIQSVVVDASVIGDELDLPTLLAVTEVAGPDALHAVHALVDDGLIVRAGDRYRFSHDKIREAALGLCAGDRASRTHLAAGRHLLGALGTKDAGAQIFAVADHLNHGRSLLSGAERIEVAALDLRAAKQALAVGATATAGPYLETGLALLAGSDPWRNHFQLVFELTLEHAHVISFRGQLERSLAGFDALLERELSFPNRIAVYLRLIATRVYAEKYEDACRTGIAALNAVGIRIPLHVSWRDRMLASLNALWKVGGAPEKFLELPTATDELVRARSELATALTIPFYFFDNNLAAVLTLKTVPRLLSDGVDPGSPLRLINYALIVQIGLNKPALARRFAGIASELHARLGSPAHTAHLLFCRYQLVEPWHVPYRESLAQFELGIQKGLDVGDQINVIACHVGRLYCALTEGMQLARVDRMGQEAHEASRRIGLQNNNRVIDSLREVLNQLRDQPIPATTEDWLATPALKQLKPRLLTSHMAATAQILVLVLRGEYDAAFALTERISPNIYRDARGAVVIWLAVFAHGAGAAVRLSGARGRLRGRYRKQLDRSIDKLRRWAVHNPVFFTHKLQWLEAERARARGDNAGAVTLYLVAREAAIAAEYPHLAAAIDLRRGELALAMDLPGEAAARFHAAIAAYRTWGAKALVSELEQRYADHVTPHRAQHTTKHEREALGESLRIAGAGPEQLDSGALISASQAIAQEVTLTAVLERVMSNTMATAGATLGVLLLEQDGGLIVQLRQRAGGRLEHCATPFEDAEDLPRSIVRYVWHSGETVVVGDAASADGYALDPWVRSGAAKSILCAPIVKQARRMGVLLLHNELVTNAFTDRHLTTLQTLAAQAAISIDNAILYDELSTLNRELEARVEDRTRALRDAQHQLIASARKAGMADLAVEVLHNVRNALNGVNISAQLVSAKLSESKLTTFHRVVAMLDEHKHHLGEFLATDERGVKVAAMLAMLSVTLGGERDVMQRELAQLCSRIEHVGAVVRELEATAEDKGIALLEAPEALIRAATAAVEQRTTGANLAISIDDELAPGAKVDKHKGLEILVGLLTNAVEAVEAAAVEPRQIQLTVRGGDNSVMFQVADNGVGIARADLTRIFHGGFSTKPDRRGASLHRFANLATSTGGSLTADSAGAGRGATFTLILPNSGLGGAQPGSRQRPAYSTAPHTGPLVRTGTP